MPSDPYSRQLNVKISVDADKAVTRVERHFQDDGYGRCKKKVVDALLRLMTADPEVILKVKALLDKSLPGDEE
jgi:hypothetical protein